MGPIHGLGVDQMLEVELVGADGSYIIANVNGTSVRSAGKIINIFYFNQKRWKYFMTDKKKSF